MAIDNLTNDIVIYILFLGMFALLIYILLRNKKQSLVWNKKFLDTFKAKEQGFVSNEIPSINVIRKESCEGNILKETSVAVSSYSIDDTYAVYLKLKNENDGGQKE